jgi:predicted ATPase
LGQEGGWMGSARKYRTTFVGREDLLRELTLLLRDRGTCVTLVGPAGVGKTRLANEAGNVIVRDLHDAASVPFVDLANARTAREVTAAWCAALGIPPTSGSSADGAEAHIARALDASGAPICIVDNCEELDGEGTAALAGIAAAVRAVPLLLTSRRPVGIQGEHLVPVPPLARDDRNGPSPAFRLLAERAGIDLDVWWGSTVDRAAVERIFLHLDGLPLAIELASWRLRLVAPGELAARVDALMPMLVRPTDVAVEGSERDRHRSLEALIDGTWQALDRHERALLAVIAELPAGASLGELEAAWGESKSGGEPVLLVVEQLVARNLVMAADRFVPYETVRAYVASKRGELHDVPPALSAVWKHLAGAAGDAARALDRDRDPSVASWLIGARLNLEGALVALTAEGADANATALHDLHLALTETFLRTGFPNDWPARIAAFCRSGRDVDGTLARACASTLRHTGRYDEALVWATHARACARPGAERARALIELSTARFRVGDMRGVVQALDEADLEAEREPSEVLHAELLWRRANVLVRGADIGPALAIAERAVRVSAQTGNVLLEAQCEHIMGWVLFEAGRAAEAGTHYARSVVLSDLAQEFGEASYAVVQGATAAFACGDLATALPKLEEGLSRARRSGHVRAEALGLAMRAIIRHTGGSLRDAEADYRDALRFGLLANDAWLGPFFLATYGAASAELGDEAVAEQRFAEAERAIAALPNETRIRRYGAVLVDTTRAVVDVMRARRARSRDDTNGVEAAEGLARAALGRCLAALTDHPTAELRVAAAVLQNALASLERSPDGLSLGRDGRWFRVAAGKTVDLSGKPTLARLAWVLAEAHVRGEREPLPRAELVRRLWPAERIEPTAAANRLAVTLSKLRTLGLGREVEVSRQGVRLRPELQVRIEGL